MAACLPACQNSTLGEGGRPCIVPRPLRPLLLLTCYPPPPTRPPDTAAAPSARGLQIVEPQRRTGGRGGGRIHLSSKTGMPKVVEAAIPEGTAEEEEEEAEGGPRGGDGSSTSGDEDMGGADGESAGGGVGGWPDGRGLTCLQWKWPCPDRTTPHA